MIIKTYVDRARRWQRRVRVTNAAGKAATVWQRCNSSDAGAARREDDHFTIELRQNRHRIARVRSFTQKERAEDHARELQQRLERGEPLDGPSLADEQARPL